MLVGCPEYDAARYVEHLPHRPPDDRGLPEMGWQMVGSLAALDRSAHTVTLIRNVMGGDDPVGQYREAVGRLEEAATALSRAATFPAVDRPAFDRLPAGDCTFTPEGFMEAVQRAKAHITAGDAFQIVPSRRVAVPFAGEAFAVYRALRLLNPSPYLLCWRQGGLAIPAPRRN